MGGPRLHPSSRVVTSFLGPTPQTSDDPLSCHEDGREIPGPLGDPGAVVGVTLPLLETRPFSDPSLFCAVFNELGPRLRRHQEGVDGVCSLQGPGGFERSNTSFRRYPSPVCPRPTRGTVGVLVDLQAGVTVGSGSRGDRGCPFVPKTTVMVGVIANMELVQE